MNVLVIIVSYNFMPWIDRCLDSLRQSQLKADVMVIDNASVDATVATVRKRYPEVKLVVNKANLGFGRANNIGMKYALDHGYDGVLLLNEDAWVNPDVIGHLSSLAVRHPEYGILSPVHLTGSGKTLEHGFATYAHLQSTADLPDGEVVDAGFIDAAIWYLPMGSIRRVGMFAPLFYHYGEDKDYCNRMAFHGLKVGYVPSVFGFHDRENRKVTRSGRSRAEWVYMLSEYANVCYSLPKAFAMSVLATCKKVMQSLVRGHLRDACSFMAIAFRLLGKTGAVIRTRRDSVKTPACPS